MPFLCGPSATLPRSGRSSSSSAWSVNTEGYILFRVHLSPRILDPCILPLGTQRTTDASDLISTLYPQRCHLIISKSLLWHFRYTFRRPFQHSTRLGNKIYDSSSGFHGHGMWSILPSWSPQGMYHIGGSKFFSIIDRLIRQGSRNTISLCKWEKNAVKPLHSFCLCHYSHVIHVSIMAALG